MFLPYADGGPGLLTTIKGLAPARQHAHARCLSLRGDFVPNRQELLVQPHRGARMAGQVSRREARFRARERQIDEHLIGRVRVERRTGIEIGQNFLPRGGAERLGADSALGRPSGS